MIKVLIVDWLGRGGIAQTTEAWRRIGVGAGMDVRVVSRPSEAVVGDVTVPKRFRGLPGALDVHMQLVRAAQNVIRTWCPQVVYLQNYWIPPVELAVVRTALAAECSLVLAVHNHRPHGLRAGTAVGLRNLLRSVDWTVCHSSFVANMLEDEVGDRASTIDLPIQLGLLSQPAVPITEVRDSTDGRPMAVLFGVLSRSYKGAAETNELGPLIREHWQLIAAGVGADKVREADVTVDRYLSEGELRWLVEASSVTLLPYHSATQSGAVVLGQRLGAPPVATDVGGIAEQVSHRSTGLLLTPEAGPAEWASALDDIQRNPRWWENVKRQSLQHVLAAHDRVANQWCDLMTSLGGRH